MCDCQHPLNYVEDMCDIHQEAYDAYCWETHPQERMNLREWWRTFTKSCAGV